MCPLFLQTSLNTLSVPACSDLAFVHFAPASQSEALWRQVRCLGHLCISRRNSGMGVRFMARGTEHEVWMYMALQAENATSCIYVRFLRILHFFCPETDAKKHFSCIRDCSCILDKVKVKSLSRVWLLATPWTVAYQGPPSMGLSRQEYWSGVPFPSP